MVVILVPFTGDESVKNLVHRMSVFAGGTVHRAVTAIIKIAQEKHAEEHARNPRPYAPPSGHGPGKATPE